MVPRIKYVLLIWDTIFTVRKFNEFDLIVPQTFFALKLIIDKMLIYQQQILRALSQFYKNNFFLTVRERWKQKPVFLATSVAVFQISLW
jgi:hypothetical protein